MNYEKIYNQLISRSKNELRVKGNGTYYERHHIIPRCLNGTDDTENLVLLTAREHFVAHKLLCEIYPDNDKLKFAVWLFINKTKSKGQARIYNITSYEYQRLKIEIANQSSKQNKGRKYSDEVKRKMSELKTGKRRIPRTEEHRRKLSESCKGNQSRVGTKHSDETKKKMSETRKRKAAENRRT